MPGPALLVLSGLCSALEAEGGQSDFFGLDSCPKNNTPVDQNRLADTYTAHDRFLAPNWAGVLHM